MLNGGAIQKQPVTQNHWRPLTQINIAQCRARCNLNFTDCCHVDYCDPMLEFSFNSNLAARLELLKSLGVWLLICCYFYASPKEIMLRDSREARYRFPRPTRRFTLITLGLLLLLGLAIGIFAYQVSPLRDGSFQPNSANAGSVIPWMGGVGENNWLQGAAVLAGLLATNLAIVLWQWSEPKGTKVSRFFRLMFWVGGGVIASILLYLISVGFLLALWLLIGLGLLLLLGVASDIFAHQHNPSSQPNGGNAGSLSQFFRLMFWAWGGAVIFISSYLMFVLYLLAQWLVD
jgi:hypothetical protein